MIDIKFNLKAETLNNSKSDLDRIEKRILKEINKWVFRFWADAKDRKYYEKYICPLGIKEGRNNAIEVCLRFTRDGSKLCKAVEDKIVLLNKDLELIERYIMKADEKGSKHIEIAVSELNCKNISTIEEIIHQYGFKVIMSPHEDDYIVIKW